MREVVLVEDDPADVELLCLALKPLGLFPRVFSDGEAAIAHAEAGGVVDGTLFLIDLNLPRRDGFEVLRSIHQLERDVSVVVWSSSDRALDREKALALGASRFLKKPGNLAEFNALGQWVASALGGAEQP